MSIVLHTCNVFQFWLSKCIWCSYNVIVVTVAGEFLLSWIKDVISTQYMNSYMKLLINVIKFNAAYLDEEVVAGLIM